MTGFPLLARYFEPQAALVIGALAALAGDLSLFRNDRAEVRLHRAASIAALAILAAILATLHFGSAGGIYGGILIFDGFAYANQLGVLAMALLVCGISTGARTPKNPAEFIAILLFATIGLTLMGAAQELLLAFLALELASLSLYILAAFDSDRPESAEAALKYFLFGAMASAFVLFGFSLLYGLTGSLDFGMISQSLASQGASPLLSVALVMILAGFGFKVAAAPFHLWAPDAYQGAPVPSAALIASASKLAGFVFFARLLCLSNASVAGAPINSLAHLGPIGMASASWMPTVAVMSGVSILLGNLAALAQRDLRRLLAYSAISHTGGLLLGVLAAASAGAAPLYYYAATYGIAALGAFGVIAVIQKSEPCAGLDDLAGLYRRSPLLAGCLLIFILSLAGIPPLAGFYGKVSVYAAALSVGGLHTPAGWLAILAIVMSAVALYYYLIVLKQAFVAPAKFGKEKIPTPFCAALSLAVCAAVLVVLGIEPSLLLRLF